MATGVIEINRLRVRANHGVAEQERIAGNVFEVTVHVRYAMDKAMEVDNVNLTLDYAEVVENIKQVMAQPSNLLEHVIARIKKELMQRFPNIQGGLIRVAKLTPPIDSCEVASVAVSYRW